MATRWQTGFAETDDTEHALARRSVAPGIYAVPVTDWTVILTSIGTASVAGVVGFKAAAMQARVSLRGIEAENWGGFVNSTKMTTSATGRACTTTSSMRRCSC